MNRRNFLGAAVAAVLAPVAFVRQSTLSKAEYTWGEDLDTGVWTDIDGKLQVAPATYAWWRNRDESRIDVITDQDLAREMERLYLECLRDPAPPNLIVWRT